MTCTVKVKYTILTQESETCDIGLKESEYTCSLKFPKETTLEQLTSFTQSYVDAHLLQHTDGAALRNAWIRINLDG